ncbi:MAG: hypothetical protein ACR2LN_00955 [Candidatus Levyibacteriota bacterium]
MTNRLLDLKKLKFEVRDTMRYDDVGDYFGNTIIAYDFKNDIITNAIFLHEFIEYTLIKSANISSQLIDQFDTNPASRTQHPEEYKLYGKFHDLANMIERQFIENLGCSWEEHDRRINMEKINVAIHEISDELHKEHPDPNKIERAKKLVPERIDNDE